MAKVSASVTLPGSLCQKNGRWWWKVKLPGETKTRARALKPEGSRYAATDRQEAEEVAREMWRLAIEAEIEAKLGPQQQGKTEQTVAKVREMAAEEIAKVKAECEKKLKSCEHALARAEEKAKTQAEARLRAEVALKAQAEEMEEYYTTEITKVKETIERAKKEFQEKERTYSKALAAAEEKTRVETQARAQAEAKLRAIAEQKASAEAQARAEAEAKLNEVLGDTEKTGTCECCDRNDVPESDLSKIDSGQLLCTDCLRMLRG